MSPVNGRPSQLGKRACNGRDSPSILNDGRSDFPGGLVTDSPAGLSETSAGDSPSMLNDGRPLAMFTDVRGVLGAWTP